MSDQNTNQFGVIQEDVSPVDREADLGAAIQEKQAEEVAAEQEVAPETEKQPDQSASKFAALSRREKSIRDRERQLEARLAEMEAKQQNMEQEYGSYKSLGKRIKTEPLKVMEENGLTFDDLSKMILDNDGAPTSDMQLRMLKEELEGTYGKQIEELKNELKQRDEKAQEQHYEETIQDYMYELSDFVNENSETYELIKSQEALDLVYQVVEQHYNDTGRILSNEDACEHVENYLFEEAKKWTSLNKIKGLFGQESPETKQVKEKRQPSVTLSNTDAAQVPTKGKRHMSKEESLAEAAKLIKWEE